MTQARDARREARAAGVAFRRSRVRAIVGLGVFAPGLVAATPGSGTGAQAGGSITYIANEGVLIEGDDRKVLIDALYGDQLLVQHHGYLTAIGGPRIPHLGDRGIDEDTFRGWRLDTTRVNYALVPFWMIIDKHGRELIARWIKPRVTDDRHVGDPAERYAGDAARALPGARLLSRSLERIAW